MIVPCDEYFPVILFDDCFDCFQLDAQMGSGTHHPKKTIPWVSSQIHQTMTTSSQGFAQSSRDAQMGSGTRHPAMMIPWVSSQTHQPRPEFLTYFVHSSPTVRIPKSDKESLNCQQAAFWETARQEELNACKANSVWSEPMKLPCG